MQGHIIPCDLHLEHLNRHLKGLLRQLNSNVTKKQTDNHHAVYPCNAINRAARSIRVLHDLCELFENECGKERESGNHNIPSFKKDVQMVVKVLVEGDVFTVKQGRKYPSFKNFNTVLQQCPKEHLKQWIESRTKTYKMTILFATN